jgi:uncharacterized membrane protein
MALLDAVVAGVHLLFAALWTGSVWFLTLGVLPTALSGDANAAPMATVTERFRWVTRASAVGLFLTGGHMAAAGYTSATLFGSGAGHLVLTMLGLWLILAALSEIGATKLASGFERDKVREPARNAKPFLYGASVVAVGLIGVASAFGLF